MSFNANILSTKPVIREAANMNNDGGGGNLGYMKRGKKDEKQERKYLDESIFNQKEEDIFGFNKELNIPEEKTGFALFVEMVLNALKKLFK